jgi:GntR family transcriptional regulator
MKRCTALRRYPYVSAAQGRSTVDHVTEEQGFAPQYRYVEVADAIAAEIASGRLPVGARLAGERELAEEHGVALGTARRAVQELRDRGLVQTLPARGTYVVRRSAEPENPDGQEGSAPESR